MCSLFQRIVRKEANDIGSIDIMIKRLAPCEAADSASRHKPIAPNNCTNLINRFAGQHNIVQVGVIIFFALDEAEQN